MSSYNIGQFKKRRSVPQLVLRTTLILAGVTALFFITRLVIHRTIKQIPLLSATTVESALTSKRALVNKITELQATIASYDAELVRSKLLESENDQLKAELNRLPRPHGTLAHVLTLPNRSFYGTFVIDAGSAEGLSVGQQVFAFNSIVLGTISSVTDHTATVVLYSEAGRETTGTTTGSDVAITLIGRGGGEYEVRMPRDVHFEVGGLIAHQSADVSVLAQIERIVTDPRDPFQKLYAKTPVNLQALKWVIVR